jgi:UMF1 family MFS transporter
MADSAKKRAWLGWCSYDWANSAFATVGLAAVLPVYFVTLVPAGGIHLPLLGQDLTITAAALWGYTISVSAVLVATLAPWLGALADARGWRRPLLILFCLAGAAGTSLLSLAGPGQFLLAALFFTLANLGFAGGNIFYNSFLPVIAAPHEVDRLSARGFAWGYLGGGICLALVFVMIQEHAWFGFAGPGEATRAGFLLTGLWWLGFALPTFLWVRDQGPRPATGRKLQSYAQTFREILPYRDLLRFLIAFLLFNDGIETIIVVSAVFGREELGMSQGAILGCFLMIQIIAMPGSLLFGRIAERWSAKAAILACLACFILLTLYAFFMHRAWEFWLLGLVVALILGGSQAISRSLFASLIPPHKEAEFFGFYAIGSKFATIFGPLLFALIGSLTGSNRLSILGLLFFFVAGGLLLLGVDVERGRRLAGKASP